MTVTAEQAGALAVAGAQAGSIPRLWQGAKSLSIVCQVATDRGNETGALRDRICRAARTAAAQGAPMPVAVVDLGDRTLLSPAAATLLVHASVREVAGRQVMALAIRPFRNSGDDPGITFGAAPRVVLLGGTPGAGDELDQAMGDLLGDTLPWLDRPRAARRIRR